MIRPAVPVLLTLALGACASVPLASRQADEEGKRFDPPATGAGTIYVYRPGGVMAMARTADVGVAGGYHAELAPDTYFRLEGPPGPIDLVCKTTNIADQQVGITSGEIRYVEVVMSAGLWGPQCSLKEVAPGEGQPAILQARRVTPQ